MNASATGSRRSPATIAALVAVSVAAFAIPVAARSKFNLVSLATADEEFQGHVWWISSFILAAVATSVIAWLVAPPRPDRYVLSGVIGLPLSFAVVFSISDFAGAFVIVLASVLLEFGAIGYARAAYRFGESRVVWHAVATAVFAICVLFAITWVLAFLE